MGYYVETPLPTGKARQIIDLYGGVPALPELPDPDSGQTLICVVQNGPFDAAGIIYDQNELNDFSDPDDYRARTWLTLPTETVIELCPRVESQLTPDVT